MATVALSTSSATLDPGTAYELTVLNSGTVSCHVQIGGGVGYDERLRPGQQTIIYPNGSAVTAFVRSGTGEVTTALSTNPETASSGGGAFLTTAAASGTYVSADVIAVGTGIDPTGVADSTTALQAKINAVPAGGRLFIPTGTYKLTAALSVTTNITIEGASCIPTFPSNTDGTTPTGLTGTVLNQTTAATDGIKLSGSAQTGNLRNLGITFAAGLASTGHGINAAPTATSGAGHTIGLNDFRWDNVQVYGHDGDHYGAYFLNPLLGTVVHFRAYLGGGVFIACDAGAINAGNITFIGPYNELQKTGSAGGFIHSSAGGNPGTLNLITYIRPQCIVGGAAKTAATQPMWNDGAGASAPRGISVFGADLESTSNPFLPGIYTTFVADGLINGASNTNTAFGVGAFPGAKISAVVGTAFGNNALGSVTTGTLNSAFGGSALAADTTGSNNTALGNNALQANTTGNTNTAFGGQTLMSTLTNSASTAVGYQALKLSTADSNTALGAVALSTATTGGSNTALGAQALQVQTTGANNTASGMMAGSSVTSGNNNTLVGYKAGVTTTGANALTTGNQNVHIGSMAGFGAADGTLNDTVAIGYQATVQGAASIAIGRGVSAGAAGSVAIGKDNGGTAASATVANAFVLGTALHKVQIKNNTTGAGSAALGANCPAVTATAPYTWFVGLSSDGSTVYWPVWK